ncbi:hypothetical protein [Francisella sp. TX07-6608]|uniref:hypothetical protein n=1 Tax=Francisella sp. TX07-6608 TaxID=573568 RepID=UPI0008F9D624|nr:hypothetical protein [Francisella sp. TX07-6608]OIN84099.1 hypothetical protein KX00_396 [Francisella sp. TX07-6608]
MKKLSNKIVVLGSILIGSTMSYAEVKYPVDVYFYNDTSKPIDYSLVIGSKKYLSNGGIKPLYPWSPIMDTIYLGKANTRNIHDSTLIMPKEHSEKIEYDISTADNIYEFISFSEKSDNQFKGVSDRYCKLSQGDSPVLYLVNNSDLVIVPKKSSPCTFKLSSGYSTADYKDSIKSPAGAEKLIKANSLSDSNKYTSNTADGYSDSNDGKLNFLIEQQKNPELSEENINNIYHKVTGTYRVSDPNLNYLSDNDSEKKSFSDVLDELMTDFDKTKPNGWDIVDARIYDSNLDYILKSKQDYLTLVEGPIIIEYDRVNPKNPPVRGDHNDRSHYIDQTGSTGYLMKFDDIADLISYLKKENNSFVMPEGLSIDSNNKVNIKGINLSYAKDETSDKTEELNLSIKYVINDLNETGALGIYLEINPSLKIESITSISWKDGQVPQRVYNLPDIYNWPNGEPFRNEADFRIHPMHHNASPNFFPTSAQFKLSINNGKSYHVWFDMNDVNKKRFNIEEIS